MRLRSKKQRTTSTTTRAGAGDVASTSASASKKRRTEKKTTTTTTDQVEDENEDVVVAKQIKKQQQKKRRGLPDELWDKILESVDDNSVMAFASVSKQLRRVQKRSGRKLKTNLRPYSFHSDSYHSGKSGYVVKDLSAVSEDWCAWCVESLTSKRDNVKRKHIMKPAAFWGHLNVLKQWKESLKLLGGAKNHFYEQTCIFAALGGHLEVLMWLRDNGCPWRIDRTFDAAARGGNVEVLKYLRTSLCIPSPTILC